MNLHTATKKKKNKKSLASDWPEFHLYRVLFFPKSSPATSCVNFKSSFVLFDAYGNVYI